VLLCDYAFTCSISQMYGAHTLVAVSESVVMLIFAWMAFRSGRWWIFAALAALVLCALVFVLDWVNPDLPRIAALSAQIGLWLLVYVSLLASVLERWLAGAQAVSPAAVWRRQRIAS
jgi:hypothetical protein